MGGFLAKPGMRRIKIGCLLLLFPGLFVAVFLFPAFAHRSVDEKYLKALPENAPVIAVMSVHSFAYWRKKVDTTFLADEIDSTPLEEFGHGFLAIIAIVSPIAALILLGMGLVRLSVGALQYVHYSSLSPEQYESLETQLRLDAVIGSMLTVAEVDGEVSDAKLEMINRIHGILFELEGDVVAIKNLMEKIRNGKWSVFPLLRDIRPRLDNMTRSNIIFSSYLVAKADGSSTEKRWWQDGEGQVIVDIGRAIGVSKKHVRAITQLPPKPEILAATKALPLKSTTSEWMKVTA